MSPTLTAPLPFQDQAEALQRVWLRIAASVTASAARGKALTTVLRRDMRQRRLAGGGRLLVVFEAPATLRRSGQARRLRLVELDARAACSLPMLPGLGWECLVLAGQVTVDGEALATLDYHRDISGAPRVRLHTLAGARLLVREARLAGAGPAKNTQRAGGSTWERLPNGLVRRRLGSISGQHTSLQWLAPGSGRQEQGSTQDLECLVLEGEIFAQDRLLRAGDFQVAPAGGPQFVLSTGHGALLYRHGEDGNPTAENKPQ
jgi:hypothetical protein